MNERRQLPRWEINKEAKVLLPQTEGFNYCIIEDMHLKGMCVSFNQRLSQPEPLKMSFAIGDSSDFITIEARISWTKEDEDWYVYGLSFSKIDDSDKDKIYQYITTHCYDQFKNKWWAWGK